MMMKKQQLITRNIYVSNNYLHIYIEIQSISCDLSKS